MWPQRAIYVSVRGVDGFHDGVLQTFDGLEVVVVNGGTLEEAPELFDEVQISPSRNSRMNLCLTRGPSDVWPERLAEDPAGA